MTLALATIKSEPEPRLEKALAGSADQSTGTGQALGPVEGLGSILRAADQTVLSVNEKGNGKGNGNEVKVAKINKTISIQDRGKAITPPSGSSSPVGNGIEVSQDERPKKRRRRIPLSCTVCRYRKLKCDRKEPCSSCVALHLEAQCIYQHQPSFEKRDKDKSDPSEMADEDEYGPDRVPLNSYYDVSIMLNKSTSSIVYINSSSPQCVGKSDSATRIYLSTLKHDMLNHIGEAKREFQISKDCRAYSVFEDDKDQVVYELSKVLLDSDIPFCKWFYAFDLLPPLSLAQELADYFLSYVNSLAHVTTAHFLQADIEETYKTYEHIQLKRPAEYPSLRSTGFKLPTVPPSGVMGLSIGGDTDPHMDLTMAQVHRLCFVLMAMHLGYMAMDFDSPSRAAALRASHPDVYLGQRTLGIAISAVKATAIDFESNLSCVQLGLMLCVYKQYVTVADDDGYNSSLVLSMTVQMAKAIGLNRDPLNFSNAPVDLHSHWRQIWRFTCVLDSLHSFDTGLPTSFPMEYTDANSRDFAFNEAVDDRDYLGKLSERSYYEWNSMARKALDTVLLVPITSCSRTTLEDLKARIDHLESHVPELAAYPKTLDPSYAFMYHNASVLWMRMLYSSLRMRIIQCQSRGPQDDGDLLQEAARIMELTRLYLDNQDKYRNFNWYTASIVVKFATQAWVTLCKLLKDNTRLRYAPELDVAAVIMDLIKYDGWVASVCAKCYRLWRHHFFLNFMLTLTLRFRGEKVRPEPLRLPRKVVWLDWVKREVVNSY